MDKEHYNIPKRDVEYEDISDPLNPEFDYVEGNEDVLKVAIKKSFWKDTAFGRTLSLRNKSGKIIATGLVGIGSSFLPAPIGPWVSKTVNSLLTIQTGVPIMGELNLLQIGITIGVMILLAVIPMLFPSLRGKAVWKVIKSRVDAVADEIVKAIDKESDGGKKITRSEIKDIIAKAIKPDK